MTDEGRKEGADVAECTADFSKIVELQEIRKLYEELQERFAGEIRRRDDEIRQLREQIGDLSSHEGAAEAPLEELRAENRRLKGEIERTREEYEAKLARLAERMRETPSRPAAGAGPGTRAVTSEPAAPPTERKGFFRS
jgi:predicted nuclease with TOPRIM domain